MQQAQQDALLAGLIAADSFDAQLDAIADACPAGMEGIHWDESTHEALASVAQLLRLATTSDRSINGSIDTFVDASMAAAHQDASASEGQQLDAAPALMGIELVVVHAAEQALSPQVHTLASQFWRL